VSLLMDLAVGVAYGLVQVRSPAPPLIALVGLLGMVLGEQAVDVARHHFVRPAHCGSSGKRLPRRHDAPRDLALNARSVKLP
jgi:XapX domain-containing protein